MKIKKFTNGITFFTDSVMYNKLKDMSDNKKIGLSELLREMIAKYLDVEKPNQQEN